MTVHCNEPFCYKNRSSLSSILKKGFYFDREWYCSESCFEMALQTQIRRRLVTRPDFDPQTRHMRLGPFLINKGLITREQLDQALNRQYETKANLGECIVELGFCSETDLTSVLSEQQGVPWVDDAAFEISREVLGLVPKFLCIEYHSFPFEISEASQETLLAIKSPIDYAFLHMIRKMLNCRIRPFLMKDDYFQMNLDRYLAGSHDDREEVLSLEANHQSILAQIIKRMGRYRVRDVRMAFYGELFWVRLSKKRSFYDLIIRVPELTIIAGSDGKSLPDEEESSARIAL